MAIDYKSLPVYEQKQKILDCLKDNQVVIVESPTGSGKTTQIPVILYEAGYAESGVIAVTQPRRIAAISVSEFISRQLKTDYPGLVGYKMRFEDNTGPSTKIKIMTDGILLQEMKLDPWLSKYSVIMVDEAHERSLNIDFVLGLLKRVLQSRKDFRVIVSSATMNTGVFSEYFGGAPIVSIDTVTYPVSVIYDPPEGKTTTATEAGTDAILSKICSVVGRVLDDDDGGILIFLPGEKIIKDCADRLRHEPFGRKLQILPLYGRLSKEEQEKVFEPPRFGRKKVVISTNIAETSVTISDISTVIDSGLAKLNFYSPRAFTSSLTETAVSKASCNQRKGRAGRTRSGTCWRLYSRKDFETRPLYTTEEIYRTDLSEVVLRMAELGITDFFNFDFISPPGREGIIGAVDTLNMLGALDDDNTLSATGKMMVNFPLEPRISRIIVEAIMRFPDVLEKTLTAAAFLSANSPFLLPQGEEMEARKAHHRFRDMQGDFVAYINMFGAYMSSPDREKFCRKNYLDDRVMAEILNIKEQLTAIVSDMNIPVTGSGSLSDYLCCIAAGMIQFVCVRTGREKYKSLTSDNIFIHPGSVMFKQNPVFIVAGEIVRTSRMFAMSVSPLTHTMLDTISPELYGKLMDAKESAGKSGGNGEDRKDAAARQKRGKTQPEPQDSTEKRRKAENPDDTLVLGGEAFTVKKVKGKKTAVLPLDRLLRALKQEQNPGKLENAGNMRGELTVGDGILMRGEKVRMIIKAASSLNLSPLGEREWNRKMNVNIYDSSGRKALFGSLRHVLRTAPSKKKGSEFGFICLMTDGNGSYWLKVSRGFSTALSESHVSAERLVEEDIEFTDEEKRIAGRLLALLNSFYE